jgi:transcriptional regulator with XRE-family HTH domain
MEQLRRIRKERGLSQAKLAARAGLDPSTVNQIETGARKPSTATLEKIAEALEVDLADLFRGYVVPKAQAPLWSDEPPAERRFSILAKATAITAERWANITAHGSNRESASGVYLAAADLKNLLSEVMDTEEVWEKLSSQERGEIASVIAALGRVTEGYHARREVERTAEQQREMMRQLTREIGMSA